MVSKEKKKLKTKTFHEGYRRRGVPLKRIEQRIAKLTKQLEIDTQKVRARLIKNLEKLFEVATEHANPETVGEKRKTKQIREWSRLAAYISQVINSVSKTYDLAKIQAELENLRRRIEEMESAEPNDNLARDQNRD